MEKRAAARRVSEQFADYLVVSGTPRFPKCPQILGSAYRRSMEENLSVPFVADAHRQRNCPEAERL
jgi:hypothetical protein